VGALSFGIFSASGVESIKRQNLLGEVIREKGKGDGLLKGEEIIGNSRTDRIQGPIAFKSKDRSLLNPRTDRIRTNPIAQLRISPLLLEKAFRV
jgi:hypothetical protein